MSVLWIESDSLKIGFDRNNGSLIHIYSKISDWEILNRPHLGLSWRLMLPLQGRRNNNAWGHLQQTRPECVPYEKGVRFIWKGITSEFGGWHNITIMTDCVVKMGQILFEMQIQNNSDGVVENVYYPCLGDLHRPGNCKKFSLMHGKYGALETIPLYPTTVSIGDWGVDWPTYIPSPAETPPVYPFALAAEEDGRGLYIGVAEKRVEAVTWHIENHPAWLDSIDNRVISEDTYNGQDVFTRFSVGHLPFIAPGETFDLLPFALEAYEGRWEKGVACYTRISRSWNIKPSVPSWASEPHSWLQIQINSPEDEFRMCFNELPKIGEECKKYGIKAIQLVGWNDGGQDRGNPSHSPDPRLGTVEELKQAISEINAMGIKVILFAKFVWSDQTGDDCKEDYSRYAITNLHGDPGIADVKGFRYMTLSSMEYVSTRRLYAMCLGSEEYRNICVKEFQKCIDLGADGILIDECFHHGDTFCCMNGHHGHRPGASARKFDGKLIEDFRELTKGRDFLYAGESVYDFIFDNYNFSYFRSRDKHHKALSRLLRPDAQIMTAVSGVNDRSMINQCLMNRYIISYEPFFFKGRPSDMPDTIAYGNRMDALRLKYRAYFWDGEFLGRGDATVIGSDGIPLDCFSVFRAADGSLGMVICNFSCETEIAVDVTLDGRKRAEKYQLVEDEELKQCEDEIKIPPKCAAIVF